MDSNQDRINELLKQFGSLMNCNINREQIEKMNNSVEQFVDALQNMAKNLPTVVLNEDMKNFIAETKVDEKLSQENFEDKYSGEIKVCEELRRSGWVVSNHSDPREIKEWYTLLNENREQEIVSYFEGENGNILENIFTDMALKYSENPNKRYFSKAKSFFDEKDYMTSAMYAVALIEARTNKFMCFPKGMRYSQKYSPKGFEKHIQEEFQNTDSIFTKHYLFLNMYPSVIEFLNRLLVDGDYEFKKGIEPPYINRNWLLHGRSYRTIERYECIQLFNALSTIEFVFSFCS